MTFVGVLLVLGLYTRQPRRYWGHAAAAVALHLLVTLLLSGEGSLVGPAGDGPRTGVVGLVVLALGWGVPIWLVTRGYHRRGEGKG